MFEPSIYIGPNAPKTYSQNLPLPSLPQGPVTLAFWQYRPNQTFELFDDSRNPDGSSISALKVKVLKPLKCGYGCKVQSILVQAEEGNPDLLGRKLVLRCFDSLYISPAQLDVIPYRKYVEFNSSDPVVNLERQKQEPISAIPTGEYKLDSNDPPPTRLLQPRSQFVDAVFRRELDAYTTMSRFDCSSAPRFYGSYNLRLEREEEECVKVIALEYIEGESLLKVFLDAVAKFGGKGADEETSRYVIGLVDRCYEAMDQLHEAQITHNFADARKCIVKEDGKIIWLDFSRSRSLQPDLGVSSEDQESFKEQDLANINSNFERVFHDLKIHCRYDDEEP
jgi:hypothetical protein